MTERDKDIAMFVLYVIAFTFPSIYMVAKVKGYVP